MILQTTEDINNMKKQLDDLLKTNNDNSNVDTAYANYANQETNINGQEPTPKQLTPNQRNTLEYRLQQFKKRNRFYKPTEHSHS